MKLSIKAFALTCGILWGLAILLITWWMLLMGAQGGLISDLSSFYPGYSYSWGGAVVGLIWGFVEGFIVGAIFAWLYNKMAKAPASS